MCDLLERVLLPVNVLSLTAVHSLFLVPASSIALCSQLSHPKTLSFVLNLELISHSLTMAINTWRGFNAFMDYCKLDFTNVVLYCHIHVLLVIGLLYDFVLALHQLMPWAFLHLRYGWL